MSPRKVPRQIRKQLVLAHAVSAEVKKAVQSGDSKQSHERTDKALTVSIVSRRDFFGFSSESVKICLTVGNQAIIAS